MKFVLVASLFLAPFALAHADSGENSAPKAVKTEETVRLTDEASQGLFERIRGAHLRAVKQGKILAAVPSAPKS